MSMLRIFSFCSLALALNACVVGPDYQKPNIAAVDAWQKPVFESELTLVEALPMPTAADWWTQFHDPLLNDLMQQGLTNNKDLAVAQANIRRAKAMRDVASSGNMPTLDANIGAGRSRFSSQSNFSSTAFTRNSFTASLDASWEPDFFGKTARAIEAADANIGVAEASRYAVELSVVAEIASNYFEIRGIERQLASTQASLRLLQSLENVVQAQVDEGVLTSADVVRVQAERDTMQASLPPLQADKTTRIYRLSVLTGQSPEYHVQAFQEPMQAALLALPSDPVPVGLRSELLQRRPDVVMAERNLAMATANIGLTEANQFPSFSLTGAIGSSARVFSDWFAANTITNSIAAALNWPLYSDVYQAQKDVAQSEADMALTQYQQSVLLALEDAESALLYYGSAWQQLFNLNKALVSQESLRDMVQARYDAGQDSFETLLTAERGRIAAESAKQQAETQILMRLSLLYKALGGEWQASHEALL